MGELRHKELWYPAEHPRIISQQLWDDVHAILSTNGQPDVILMDINLPDISGVAAHFHLMARDKKPKPVVGSACGIRRQDKTAFMTEALRDLPHVFRGHAPRIQNNWRRVSTLRF